ncbi:hypothetical protein [Prevotella sp.]|uniref:hypothetical protein n=1 Tax=Prevotella sp. TaxID=59823 RepID=UPI001CB42EED|nr:hypothetical protein [Prevotella sp.]MBF1622220.1 hypothetical protein [Prevotella sp.]
MKQITLCLVCGIFVASLTSCDNGSRNSTNSSNTYTQSQDFASGDDKNVVSEVADVVDQVVESSPYVDNYLQTGSAPYSSNSAYGDNSTITVRTSSSDNDVVVIVKSYGEMVRNAYIQGGDSYTFNLPSGNYQVFFYGGKGWDPTKDMNGYQGGFVYQETFSKDDPIDLEGQRLEYELILQQNGNFQTKGSSENEVF